MNRLRIGVRLESMGLPLRAALDLAGRIGAAGVQFDAVGELAPERLSQTGRRELRHLLSARELEVTAVGCPLRYGLDMPEKQEARLDHVKQVLALSFELGPRTVIASITSTAIDPEAPNPLLVEALDVVARHGDRVGAVLAVQTGLEAGDQMAAFLRRFDTGGLGVNVDPGAFLFHGFDPYENTHALRGLVRHAHATDARRAGARQAAQEVALGHGDIDWLTYLGVLEEIEYREWLTVKRDGGDNRRAELEAGVGFLRRLGA
jgi:sugar phosphate isomerase/epimerase